MTSQNLWGNPAWDALLYAIEGKLCTPFLGAGACAGVLPTGKQLAQKLAGDSDYPFGDSDNLVRVAQFAAVEGNEWAVKGKVCKILKSHKPPDFDDDHEPHRVMADLGLPVYITTNYDDFMVKAIAHVGRAPQKEICHWYEARQRQQEGRSAPHKPEADWLDPAPDRPVVYHLHGTWDDERSIVLTEDDYLDFLIYAHDLIPSRIERAFTESSLLFLGYSFEDMNFKVLFRKVATRLRLNTGTLHAAVQLAPKGQVPTPDEQARAERQRQYLERQFFQRMNVRIYWGTCEKFVTELRGHL